MSYVPPSPSSPSSNNEWSSAFSSRKKHSPRMEFPDDASRAFSRRQDDGDQMRAFGTSNRSETSSVLPRQSHNDTGAFGGRGSGSSVFTDEAASAFGKRTINKKFGVGESESLPAVHGRNSMGAHLASLFDVVSDDKKEWKQSALRVQKSKLDIPKVKSMEEMFPTIGLASPKPPTASDSKQSFKNIIQKRAEQDALEEQKMQHDIGEKLRKEYEQKVMCSISRRMQPKFARTTTTTTAAGEEDHSYCEDDLDNLAVYDKKPIKSYVNYDCEEEVTYEDGENGHDDEYS